MIVSCRGRSPRLRHRWVPIRVTAGLLAAVAVLTALGCDSVPQSPARLPVPAEVVLDAAGKPAGLEAYRKWSEKLGQGAQPKGDVAFANLAAMGYRTLISVDGARPDAASAAKYGMRYVHVPFGYDGIPKDAQARIVKAAQASDGPVFIHCHHGHHRGPAAAMIAREALDGISHDEALAELRSSGCDEHYKGLYRDVMNAVPPSATELASLPADLPSYVSPGDLAAHMAALGLTWERVGMAKSAAWAVSAAQPDVDPPHEARILWEGLREIGRTDEAKAQGDEFASLLQRSEAAGHALEEALLAKDAAASGRAFDGIKKSCAACHDRFRDQ